MQNLLEREKYLWIHWLKQHVLRCLLKSNILEKSKVPYQKFVKTSCQRKNVKQHYHPPKSCSWKVVDLQRVLLLIFILIPTLFHENMWIKTRNQISKTYKHLIFLPNGNKFSKKQKNKTVISTKFTPIFQLYLEKTEKISGLSFSAVPHLFSPGLRACPEKWLFSHI